MRSIEGLLALCRRLPRLEDLAYTKRVLKAAIDALLGREAEGAGTPERRPPPGGDPKED